MPTALGHIDAPATLERKAMAESVKVRIMLCFSAFIISISISMIKNPLFIYLQYYLEDIIFINSNKKLQRTNVHHNYRSGYFRIYRLSEKAHP